MRDRVCLGAITGAHGVRGAFKIKAFTEDPSGVGDYGPVETEDGDRRLTLSEVKPLKGDLVLASAPEVTTREDAESLKGVRLYVSRDVLPSLDDPDEYYLADLIGLKVADENGAAMGRVVAVHNFGAGDLLEIDEIPDVKGRRVIEFTRINVPAIDIDSGKVTIRRDAIAEATPNATGGLAPDKI